VIDVPNGSDIHVRLRTIKFFLRHKSPKSLSQLLLPVSTPGRRRSGSSPQTSGQLSVVSFVLVRVSRISSFRLCIC
jgi:hypothetical protein